jgi:hypothetical protein
MTPDSPSTPPQDEARKPMRHTLKILPRYFEPVVKGVKTFEIRKDDRGFRVGDTLVLREYDFESNQSTGRECKRVITYKFDGGLFGVAEGFCVLAIAAPLKRIPFAETMAVTEAGAKKALDNALTGAFLRGELDPNECGLTWKGDPDLPVFNRAVALVERLEAFIELTEMDDENTPGTDLYTEIKASQMLLEQIKPAAIPVPTGENKQ